MALHSETSGAGHEESLAWVRWMFQSIRIRCDAIVFETASTNRSGIIADWQDFSDKVWHPILAPMLLAAWHDAQAGDVASLIAEGCARSGQLTGDARERSVAAGELLLRATHGAKYQGVLGQLRQELGRRQADAPLAVIWAAVSVLFQLPPADMLTEYLREEWLTALREHPQPHEPQGPLSFSAMAHRALRGAGIGASFAA